ncbi:hypothetical protein CcCBS67573_g03319 [Chytriomyces confervae]|uniref:NADH-ubiquinone oxidoreductase 21kDa subunit N-terminal domain-containing protein n=1 Tax=Chytriomyces confervae TaxID=246404 RepID=A0A507FGU4_9FUNG|nr:hypothetical protein CcCBS67573_g03319 [Chytriomyces confervae]
MKFVSNLPDQEHVPYKFIAAEPHFKYVMSYMRSSDIVMAGAIGAGFPAAHMSASGDGKKTQLKLQDGKMKRL